MNRLLLLPLLLLTTTASAYPCNLTGSLFGMVTQNGIDLDGDGFNGRSGLLRARGSSLVYADVNVDATLAAEQTCPAGQVQITPSGQVAFSTLDGNSAVFAAVDPTTKLCLGATEVVKLTITGGRGAWNGATGVGSITLPDDVTLNSDAFGRPRVVYVHDGAFELRVR